MHRLAALDLDFTTSAQVTRLHPTAWHAIGTRPAAATRDPIVLNWQGSLSQLQGSRSQSQSP